MAGDPSWDIPCYWEPEAERMAQGKERTLSKIVNNGNFLQQNTHIVIMEYLPITWENRKLRLENQMVYALPFQKPQKIWAVI